MMGLLHTMPGRMDDYLARLWRLGYPKSGADVTDAERSARTAEMDALDRECRALLNLHVRLTKELPEVFAKTNPGEWERSAFQRFSEHSTAKPAHVSGWFECWWRQSRPA